MMLPTRTPLVMMTWSSEILGENLRIIGCNGIGRVGSIPVQLLCGSRRC
jgi:hypothetical protein